MTFNSYLFALGLLPLSIIGYFGLNKIKCSFGAKVFLLLISWAFYGFFNYKYIFIILFSILFNFTISKLFIMLNLKAILRKAILVFGVAINLGVLFYFKYYDFSILNINSIFKSNFNLLHVVLPLGISFFTFQQLSYLIDSYKGQVPNYNFLDYSLFVSFFPQLVAGPIVLHSEIVPQFAEVKNRVFCFENFSKGITAFAAGLAKKVLIADVFGQLVNWGYSNIDQLGTTNAVLVMLAYTIQIYFDFSGYCDMAYGIGLMFNIKIVQNFNSPYKAHNISDFWKRWHITLTRFFTGYIYIPLGGNRKGKLRTYINVFLVFFASGIWHGANWSFILWGVLHGVAVIFNRIFKEKIDKLPRLLTQSITFLFVNLTWVLFRAPTISDAGKVFKAIFSLDFKPISANAINVFALNEFVFLQEMFGLSSQYFNLFLLIFAFAIALYLIFKTKNTYERIASFQPKYSIAISNAILLAWSVISFSSVSTFLYFNF